MGNLSMIPVEKLSAAIEELGLQRRAYNMLKRADINHVSAILISGEIGVSRLKDIGPSTVDHIFDTVASFLNTSRDSLSSREILQMITFQGGKTINPLTAHVGILGLPPSIVGHLGHLGIITLNDLLEYKRVHNGNKIRKFSLSTTREIFSTLDSYLSSIGAKQDHYADQSSLSNMKKIPDAPTRSLSGSQCLRIVYDLLVENERMNKIIDLRANQLFTLTKIAASFGLSQQRIRQLIGRFCIDIRNNLDALDMFGGLLEASATQIVDEVELNNLSIDSLVERTLIEFSSAEIIPSAEDIEAFITVIRLLVIDDENFVAQVLKTKIEKFIYLSCLLKPPIKKHKRVAELYVKRDARRPTLKREAWKPGNKELVVSILFNENKPLHWSEISKHLSRLGYGNIFSSSSMYGLWMSHPSLFRRVGDGVYELVKLDIAQITVHSDTVAKILSLSEIPLSAKAIFQRVKRTFQVSLSTLVLMLEIDPKFYRSLTGTYGLRSWLGAQDQNMEGASKSFVEEVSSSKRVELAHQRGFDVENMMNSDVEKTWGSW